MITSNEERFIITVRKSSANDLERFSSASLITSLLERHSMFEVVKVIEQTEQANS